jgi:hypothetical protein
MSQSNMSGSTDNSITITRALVELKTLTARIEKAERQCVFISVKSQNDQAPKEKITENHYQKLMDLISYRKKLKSAVVLSNARTQVQIEANRYTVAEAIERKESISYEKTLLAQMKLQLTRATQEVENYNVQVQKKLDKLLEVSFGSNQKNNLEEMKTFSENFLRTNRYELVDPMRLAEKIDQLEDQIIKFESEVDLVLSESNATTKIVV